MFYNGTLNGNNFGSSTHYVGNSYISVDVTVGIPPIPVIPEIKPYGFVGNATVGTIYNIHKGVSYGCFDDRPIPDVSQLKSAPGSSQVYSTLVDDKGNMTQAGYAFFHGALIKMLTKYMDGSAEKSGFGIEIDSSTPTGTQSINVYVPNEGTNQLVMYTYLFNILNNIMTYLSDLRTWINQHQHPNGNGGSPTGTPTPPLAPENTYYTGSGYHDDSTKMKTQRPAT